MTQSPQIGSYDDETPRPPQGLALASLIFGLLSLPGCLIPIVGILFGIIAIVLGSIAKSRADRGEAGGRDLAQAGFICGIIGLILGVTVAIVTMVYYEELESLRQRLLQQRQQQIAPATAPATAPEQ